MADGELQYESSGPCHGELDECICWHSDKEILQEDDVRKVYQIESVGSSTMQSIATSALSLADQANHAVLQILPD